MLLQSTQQTSAAHRTNTKCTYIKKSTAHRANTSCAYNKCYRYRKYSLDIQQTLQIQKILTAHATNATDTENTHCTYNKCYRYRKYSLHIQVLHIQKIHTAHTTKILQIKQIRTAHTTNTANTANTHCTYSKYSLDIQQMHCTYSRCSLYIQQMPTAIQQIQQIRTAHTITFLSFSHIYFKIFHTPKRSE